MDAERKRLTLDIDASVQRRLKVVAALKGVTMRQYCQTAINKELARDAVDGIPEQHFNREAFERLVGHRGELFGGQPLPEDSVELLREARETKNTL